MKYIQRIIIVCIVFYPVYTYANQVEKPIIILRINWEANELFTSLESTYWQDILEKRMKSTQRKLSAQEIKDQKRVIAYINENFSPENTITKTITHDTQD